MHEHSDYMLSFVSITSLNPPPSCSESPSSPGSPYFSQYSANLNRRPIFLRITSRSAAGSCSLRFALSACCSMPASKKPSKEKNKNQRMKKCIRKQQRSVGMYVWGNLVCVLGPGMKSKRLDVSTQKRNGNDDEGGYICMQWERMTIRRIKQKASQQPPSYSSTSSYPRVFAHSQRPRSGA
jgi:hypothetical protein